MPTRKPQSPPPPPPASTTQRHKKGSLKFFRRVRTALRSLPIMSTPCKMPVPIHSDGAGNGKQTTGTLFGYRKSRINLAIQENPRSLPILILELSINTGKLLHDMGLGMVRIALECEKRHHGSEKMNLADEPIWTLYCNARKAGYAVKREPTDEDLHVVHLLRAVSMGAGVLPAVASGDAATTTAADNGELTYLRACFERTVGSRDSETYYMMNPDNSGPELSIFFVRV